MINKILAKFFGTKNEREISLLNPLVEKINALEKDLTALSDEALTGKTLEFKERFKQGESLDSLLPEAFAVCREASRRVLGMRHYDVQLVGGIMLHRGRIAEMRTGEGKTLVATLPVYLNAISGAGVHVVTVNDYLAKRDAEWMGKLYGFLGLTTGIIVHDISDSARRKNYAADITYATNNELGFDYLRDNMKFDAKDFVQRPLNFAIIDECDSILIDEARTPLIISGPSESSTDKYVVIDAIIPKLKKEEHFVIEEKGKNASLTDLGNTRVEELLGIENLYDPKHISILHHIYQALKAHHLYTRDVDYMVKDGEIVIVDEFTGRLMPGRRWSDGLHQAIEAKEKVKVKNENQTLASITFQNFFKMYKKMAGMTGTADTEAVEFKKIYNLDVSVIPTNKSIQRIDHDDVVYKNLEGKYRAIVNDIKERREKGQPVLVGTVSIEKSELLSRALDKAGVRHQVLNAKHHEREADIIAQAGRKGSITIATNMAGRGTDILLGGNPEALAKQIVKDSTSEEYQRALVGFKEVCEKEKQEVLAAGGLYIVGTERHESRRIDNQLRGRAGRQGDPGESRFYLSLDDNLMRIFNGERIKSIMDRLNVSEDEPITAKMVSNAIEGSQRKVEGHNFDIRKHLLDYDNVMNQQRQVIYSLRRSILEGKEPLDAFLFEILSDVTSEIFDDYLPEENKKQAADLDGLVAQLNKQFGLQLTTDDLVNKKTEVLIESVKETIKAQFAKQKEHLGALFEQVLKMVLLQTIDQRWKEHLQLIDHLKEGIGLRGFAQKDPLIEYKKEAFNAFSNLNRTIKSESIEKIFKIQLVVNSQVNPSDMIEETDLDDLNYQAPSESDIGHSLPNFTKGSERGSSSEVSGAEFNDSSLQQGGPSRVSMSQMRGGPAGQDGSKKMNRAERRRLEKRGQ